MVQALVLTGEETQQLLERETTAQLLGQYQDIVAELNRDVLPHRRKALGDFKKGLEQCISLALVGAEPGNPPNRWFVGTVESYSSSGAIDEAAESAGCDLRKDSRNNRRVDMRLYVGDMPESVVEVYRQANGIVGKKNVMVTSPDGSLFKEPIVRERRDPMMFAWVSRCHSWMRLATWGLAGDLKHSGE